VDFEYHQFIHLHQRDVVNTESKLKNKIIRIFFLISSTRLVVEH